MAESLKWGVCPDAQWWFHCSRFPAGGCPFQRPRRSIHLRHHICSAFQFSMKIYSNIIANEMDSVPTISIIHFVFHIRACPVFVSKKLMISQAGQLKAQDFFDMICFIYWLDVTLCLDFTGLTSVLSCSQHLMAPLIFFLGQPQAKMMGCTLEELQFQEDQLVWVILA